MTKRCKKSILCQPRRGRCCLGGAVFVVLHFRHLRIALSSSEALRGVSTNSQRLSPNQALHLSSLKAEHQTHRILLPLRRILNSACLILLATESALRTARTSCRGPCKASPEERDLHSPLVTAHSVLLFLLPRLISSFLRGNSGQGPTESSWSSSSVSVPTRRSSAPPAFPLRSLPPSLLQGTHCR